MGVEVGMREGRLSVKTFVEVLNNLYTLMIRKTEILIRRSLK